MASPFGTLATDSDPPRLWVGQSIPRVEDPALLTGRGRFIDDLGIRPGTLHAAILRSSHAHADIVAIDAAAARGATGVAAVLAGDDVKALTSGLVVGVKAPVECWPLAVGRVRFVGEPVAVVVASDRYLAEDAVDLIEVQYRVRPVIVDTLLALAPEAPLLHDGFQATWRAIGVFATAIPSGPRRGRSPDSDRYPLSPQFLHADRDLRHRRRIRRGRGRLRHPRQFPGTLQHPCRDLRALKVSGNRLRLRTPPNSGGSFGVKQGIFPYIVLIGAASRVVGRPVKWIEDRLEHLTASVSATNRATTLAAAVAADGKILALEWDQVEDCGAHLPRPSLRRSTACMAT